jgi:hypothetical protein
MSDAPGIVPANRVGGEDGDNDGPARAAVAALIRYHCARGLRVGVYLRETFGPRLLAEVEGCVDVGGPNAARSAIEQGREVLATIPLPGEPSVGETFASPIARRGRVIGAVIVCARKLRPEDRASARSLASAVAGVLAGSARLDRPEPT